MPVWCQCLVSKKLLKSADFQLVSYTQRVRNSNCMCQLSSTHTVTFTLPKKKAWWDFSLIHFPPVLLKYEKSSLIPKIYVLKEPSNAHLFNYKYNNNVFLKMIMFSIIYFQSGTFFRIIISIFIVT